MIQYISFLTIVNSINLFCWYYVTVFCGVYETSASGWIYGSIFSILIDWLGFSLILPFIKTSLRVIARKFKFMKYVAFLEYTFQIKYWLG